jgi:hypothetical protein
MVGEKVKKLENVTGQQMEQLMAYLKGLFPFQPELMSLEVQIQSLMVSF